MTTLGRREHRRPTATPRHAKGNARDGEAATVHAPHVRAATDHAHRQRLFVAGLLPCLVLGVHNAGHEARLGLAATGGAGVPGWRGAVLAAAGLPSEDLSTPACLAHGFLHLLPLLAVVAATVVACERLFARVRAREPVPGAAATALLFTMCLPPALPAWQAAIGAAFGVVLAKEVFGGTGRQLFHPVATGIVFLVLSFPSDLRPGTVWTAAEGYDPPDALSAVALGGATALRNAGTTWWDAFAGREPGGLGDTSALGCLLGAAWLVARRLGSWRVMAGAALGLATTAAALPGSPGHSYPGVPPTWHLVLGSFAFAVVFLATDPATSACTDPGRWIHGILVGSLTALIRIANPAHPEGAFFGVLLGNALAPLADRAVVRVHALRRRAAGRRRDAAEASP